MAEILSFSSRSADHISDGGWFRYYRRAYTEGDSIFGHNRRLLGIWNEILALATPREQGLDMRFGESWIHLNYGECVINYRDLARLHEMPFQRVHDACQRMAKEGRINLAVRRVRAGKCRCVTVVTVVNFGLYQHAEGRTTTRQEPDSKTAPVQCVNGSAATANGLLTGHPNKKGIGLDVGDLFSESEPSTHMSVAEPTDLGVPADKAKRKRKPKTRHEYPPWFEEFYAAFPKRNTQSKYPALEACLKAIDDGLVTPSELTPTVARAYGTACGGFPQLIQTWINAEGYNAECVKPNGGSGHGRPPPHRIDPISGMRF